MILKEDKRFCNEDTCTRISKQYDVKTMVKVDGFHESGLTLYFCSREHTADYMIKRLG